MVAAAAPDRAAVIAALEAVHDPHVPASLRRMGMLGRVEVDDDGEVEVEVRIPCMACPGAATIRADIEAALRALDGVRTVRVRESWHLPWSREMIAPEVRDLMRRNGIQV